MYRLVPNPGPRILGQRLTKGMKFNKTLLLGRTGIVNFLGPGGPGRREAPSKKHGTSRPADRNGLFVVFPGGAAKLPKSTISGWPNNYTSLSPSPCLALFLLLLHYISLALSLSASLSLSLLLCPFSTAVPLPPPVQNLWTLLVQ